MRHATRCNRHAPESDGRASTSASGKRRAFDDEVRPVRRGRCAFLITFPGHRRPEMKSRRVAPGEEPGDRATMPRREEPTTICEFCRRGQLIKRIEEIAFRQPSDIGYIRCRVAVSIGFCDVCEARSVDPGVDKIFDEAFQHEYGRALKRRRRCRPPVTARPSAAAPCEMANSCLTTS
jgi:hypothetical protein